MKKSTRRAVSTLGVALLLLAGLLAWLQIRSAQLADVSDPEFQVRNSLDEDFGVSLASDVVAVLRATLGVCRTYT